jgi:outer membrane protein
MAFSGIGSEEPRTGCGARCRAWDQGRTRCSSRAPRLQHSTSTRLPVLTRSFRTGALALALFFLPQGSTAQTIVPVALTLEQAIDIARQNNPGLQAARNDEDVANWNVRSAYGALFPSASVNGGISWQGAGEQRFGSLTAEQLGFANQPSFLFSNYNLSLDYQINGRTLLAPGQAKANRGATQAQMAGTEATLVFQVTQHYLEVLRQIEQVRVSQQQRERANFNFRLATARLEVGTATGVDVAQAEVAVGRAEVTILQTANALETAQIRLLQQMGTDLDSPFVPTTPFRLSEPLWDREGLYQLGLDSNPNLRSLRASRSASSYGVRMAKSSYFPSLSLRASTSGFTRQASSTALSVQQAEFQAQSSIQNCLFFNDVFSRLTTPLPTQNCSQLQFTDADAQAIENGNSSFPFDFTGQPATFGLSISLPLFQGLSRQRQVTEARVQLDDIDINLREQELAIRADIATMLATVRAAYQVALIEEQNQTVVDEQLRLARERFTVGLADFLELLEAETLKVEADREQISAIFAYHESLANLEAIVGTSIRTP